LVALFAMGNLGYSKRTAFKSAMALSQASEFSVVLAVLGVQHGLISQDIAVTLTFITLLTIAGSTYLILFGDKLFAMFESWLSVVERGQPRHEHENQQHYDLILFGFQRGGQEFIKTFRSLGRDFVVIDYDPEIIDRLERLKINCLFGDATDPELLAEAGAAGAKLIVSSMSDLKVNLMLLDFLGRHNADAVAIFQADSAKAAVELYEHGASYVMLPHYIGSEQIGAFIKKSGLAKSHFNRYKAGHLSRLRLQQKKLEDRLAKTDDEAPAAVAGLVKNLKGLKS
jgi:hypothetical protein